jgi:2-succinyl-6-hydroxy-2,4-cyclohexadiene-1-carboxylate synthase
MSLLSVQREGSGSAFVWLHGFTQTRASAHQFRSILAGTNELLTLDLPGHGTAEQISASLRETADLVADVLPEAPVALGGYSFGGRIALHVALHHPERLNRLVLIGATRGIEDEVHRQERRARDEALATRIEEIGTKAFLDEWLAQPLFADLRDDPLERASRSRSASGLATSLRRSGTGTQKWLAPMLTALNVPTLALAGAKDQKFSLEAKAIAREVTHGSYDLIESAGHAAHLSQPLATAERVASFLNG